MEREPKPTLFYQFLSNHYFRVSSQSLFLCDAKVFEPNVGFHTFSRAICEAVAFLLGNGGRLHVSHAWLNALCGHLNLVSILHLLFEELLHGIFTIHGNQSGQFCVLHTLVILKSERFSDGLRHISLTHCFK